MEVLFVVSAGSGPIPSKEEGWVRKEERKRKIEKRKKKRETFGCSWVSLSGAHRVGVHAVGTLEPPLTA